MSTGTKPQVLLPAYDAQDLRRRMLVCFTIGEMFTLAAKLQVQQTPSWSNNPQEAARDIVRHFERSGALAFLVEALREAKPLVEWPEPLPLPIPPAPPPAGRGLAPFPPPAAGPPIQTSSPTAAGPAPAPAAAASAATPAFAPTPAAPAKPSAPASAAAGGATILGVPAPQALEYADTALEAPAGDRPTPITDVPAAMIQAAARGTSAPPDHASPAPSGFAPSVMPRPGELPPSPKPSSPGGSQSAAPALSASPAAPPAPTQALPTSDTLQDPLRPPPVSRPQAAWPGTTAPRPDASNKLPDPRILMAVGAGVLLVLIGIAFLAGRASSGPVAAASDTSSTASGPPPDHVPIAQNAADALGESLMRVAKACQIDPSTLRGRSLFEVAYRKCGPLPPPTSQPAGPRPSNYDPVPGDPADPSAAADADPSPTGGKKGSRPAAKSNKPQAVDTPPAPAGGGGSGCLSGCQRSHSACTSRCGPEPQSGSQYDAYISCQSGCLKALSQCKMGCN